MIIRICLSLGILEVFCIFNSAALSGVRPQCLSRVSQCTLWLLLLSRLISWGLISTDRRCRCGVNIKICWDGTIQPSDKPQTEIFCMQSQVTAHNDWSGSTFSLSTLQKIFCGIKGWDTAKRDSGSSDTSWGGAVVMALVSPTFCQWPCYVALLALVVTWVTSDTGS